MPDNKDYIEILRDLPAVFNTKDGVGALSPYYKAPLKALESLSRRGILMRLRRGHYALVDSFDPLVAANLIYGPSYISFETALAHYGLIPEATELYISVVDGRPTEMQTPAGIYSYISQSRSLFALGRDLEITPNRALSIASREKALLDTIARANLRSASAHPKDVLEYVIDGLRIEESDLKSLALRKLKQLAPLYRNLAPRKLVTALSERT
jgi:hypothetical protein